MLRKFGRPSRVGPQNYLHVEHPGWAIAAAARTAVQAGLKNVAAERDGREESEERDERGGPDPGRAARRRDAAVRLRDVRRDDRR
jgi:hypothetical protein